ncbi:probable CCR4-associated factor 1 homolog 11 [Phragmites australis]|uniref:probable CCR4-associated factor 1 homolog 11 n=1 Tax=Phragmites australis TaxID=29695 RepID=UPI002D783C2C|nr:probable CCR4-associated factor 1 homolog 11 [Phragmites australis]
MVSRNAGTGAAAAMFPLAPPPPLVFPFPPPALHAAPVQFMAPAAQFLPSLPHATVPYYGGVVRPATAAATTLNILQIRSVTATNFEAEVELIGSLLPRFPFVVVDTEYPGNVHRPPAGRRDGDLAPDERYALVKANVDELPIVQLGVTLCDEQGNLPVLLDSNGRPVFELAWEVNFSDFDVYRDRHAPESVAFLRSHGIDFDLARAYGISSLEFADKLVRVLSSQRWDELTWAAFGGAYDFGYLVKMLTGGRQLPETREEFIVQARELLGGRVFDAKYMAEHCGRADLRGYGLKRVAASLGVPQHFPPPCLAGPKSHVACRIYTVMRRRVLYHDGGACHEGLIHGLH